MTTIEQRLSSLEHQLRTMTTNEVNLTAITDIGNELFSPANPNPDETLRIQFAQLLESHQSLLMTLPKNPQEWADLTTIFRETGQVAAQKMMHKTAIAVYNLALHFTPFNQSTDLKNIAEALQASSQALGIEYRSERDHLSIVESLDDATLQQQYHNGSKALQEFFTLCYQNERFSLLLTTLRRIATQRPKDKAHLLLKHLALCMNHPSCTDEIKEAFNQELTNTPKGIKTAIAQLLMSDETNRKLEKAQALSNFRAGCAIYRCSNNMEISQNIYEQFFQYKGKEPLSKIDIEQFVVPLFEIYHKGFTRIFSKDATCKNHATTLIQNEIDILHSAPRTGKHNVSIICLCDLLLRINSKDPHALFCRGVAKYRELALTEANPSIADLKSVLDDLACAYKYADKSDISKSLYLTIIYNIMNQVIANNPNTQLPSDLQKLSEAYKSLCATQQLVFLPFFANQFYPYIFSCQERDDQKLRPCIHGNYMDAFQKCTDDKKNKWDQDNWDQDDLVQDVASRPLEPLNDAEDATDGSSSLVGDAAPMRSSAAPLDAFEDARDIDPLIFGNQEVIQSLSTERALSEDDNHSFHSAISSPEPASPLAAEVAAATLPGVDQATTRPRSTVSFDLEFQEPDLEEGDNDVFTTEESSPPPTDSLSLKEPQQEDTNYPFRSDSISSNLSDSF